MHLNVSKQRMSFIRLKYGLQLTTDNLVEKKKRKKSVFTTRADKQQSVNSHNCIRNMDNKTVFIWYLHLRLNKL